MSALGMLTKQAIMRARWFAVRRGEGKETSLSERVRGSREEGLEVVPGENVWGD